MGAWDGFMSYWSWEIIELSPKNDEMRGINPLRTEFLI